MGIFKPKNGHGNLIVPEEERLENIKFNVFKFSTRPKPEAKKTLIVSSFSEFGCEAVTVMYGVPRILKMYPDKYIIVAGWYGRDYLYRHLVDEYWEIKEEHQWLRDYCRAFHNLSKNLKQVEKSFKSFGTVISSNALGAFSVVSQCAECGAFSNFGDTSVEYPNTPLTDGKKKCTNCGSTEILSPLFKDILYWKPRATRVPTPGKAAQDKVAQYLKPNSVGIFARGRKTYGRNLQPEFYIKLIALLEEMGFNPIWLGEKVNTQPCPVEHIMDFSRMEESRNLELTLAIISQLKFTLQYWTASTRLASMLGVPYLLFESPDQIYGNGQEGFRRNLCDFGPNKLVIAHFRNMYENHERALALTRQAVQEMVLYQYGEIYDADATKLTVGQMRDAYMRKVLK